MFFFKKKDKETDEKIKDMKEENVKEVKKVIKEKAYLKCRCGKVFGKNGVSMRRNPNGEGYLCTECVINKILK